MRNDEEVNDDERPDEDGVVLHSAGQEAEVREEISLAEWVAAFKADVGKAAEGVGLDEARYLIDLYANTQRQRLRCNNQVRAATAAGEPCALIAAVGKAHQKLEGFLRGVLEGFAGSQPAGKWALEVHGIGPVIAAGLVALVDVEKAPTAGAVWRFAGLDPSRTWLGRDKANAVVRDVIAGAKSVTPEHVAEVAARTGWRGDTLVRLAGEKLTGATLAKAAARRPYCASLKTLLYHAGECFKRTASHPDSFYGRVYVQRKAQEVERNMRGEYAQIAADTLASKAFGKGTEAYKRYSKGLLPDGRLDLRASRIARKLFVAHYWEVAYWHHYGKRAPEPWVIAHGGHVHYIPPPNAPWETVAPKGKTKPKEKKKS